MIHIIIAIISLVILLKSADLFVDQSIALAKKIKISSFLIGFILISLGTSLPDIVIATYSTIKGHADVAISTFIGSALVNISLLLGILAIFSRYKILDIDIKKNIPITLFLTILFTILLLAFNFQLPWYIGILTIALLLTSIYFAKKNNHTITVKADVKFNTSIFLLSFALLILMGKLCVDNIIQFASTSQIQETTIGYFVLAIGISIPELVTSFTVIKKGNLQLSLGNILGATLINILLVSGISAIIEGNLNLQQFAPELMYLLFAMVIFYLFAVLGRKKLISKPEGIGLLLVYTIFILLQALNI